MKKSNISEFDMVVNGVTLRFRKYEGKKKSDPIVLIHGLSGNLQFMNRLADVLQVLDCDIYSYDLRGRGRSDKPRGIYDAEVHAKDLLAAIDLLGLGRIRIVAHSLGAWVSLAFAKLAGERLSKLILLDGAGIQPVSRKLRNLNMVRLSLSRMGRFFTSKEEYFKEIADSPFLTSWNKKIEQMFDYELSGRFRDGVGGLECNIPLYVMEAELNSLGGSLTNKGLLLGLFLHPIDFFLKMKKNNHLPYASVSAPTLVVRAMRANLKYGDEMLPDPSYSRILKEIPNARGLTLHEYNHYQFIIEDCPVLDREMVSFLEDSY
ncbi:alpha/beta hydrolase [Leptospira kobayashii]|uniref:Alpha/beta hydrolase n=1 Tax=Leptospira kobayashii TaxID=1917830 RepID=A0ABM7URE8_9LEPT|nr:alpha/beta hydrolase [Leptospira kobayashii]BDA78705.1 alpha/beta hydrolase [Leptospira kobayashii]